MLSHIQVLPGFIIKPTPTGLDILDELRRRVIWLTFDWRAVIIINSASTCRIRWHADVGAVGGLPMAELKCDSPANAEMLAARLRQLVHLGAPVISIARADRAAAGDAI